MGLREYAQRYLVRPPPRSSELSEALDYVRKRQADDEEARKAARLRILTQREMG